MRIDPSQVLVQSGVKVTPEKGAFTDSLKAGDRVRAEFVSNDNGAVVMKTADGELFKARLDTDVALTAGDKLLLEFVGREDENIVLSVVKEETQAGQSADLLRLVRDFDDKSLAQMAAKLSELNLPVSEKTARLMLELLQQNPGMTPDEAAFIASNKLTGDESLARAALALLSDGTKTDAVIEKLIDLLNQPETARTTPPSPIPNSELPPSDPAVPHSAFRIPNSSITSWLAQIGEGTDDGFPIITQSDTNMQSRITPNIEENPQNNAFFDDLGGVNGETGEFGIRNSEFGIKHEGEISQIAIHDSQLSDAQVNSEFGIRNSEFKSEIAKIISEIPEFRGTPAEAVERFANMLVRVAGESADISAGNSEKLKELLENLFTRIERNDENAGERLKSAKEELFARLAIIEETIDRASPPARTEMLQQTRSLMDHVRLLNNIGQFVYMQLPVKMGEENKTAELYLFKRKGGRKPDPENVNILLAIDLENMGRWEALLNIKGRDISIQMEVRGAEEKEFFSENTVLLHNILDEAGFKLVSTGITHSENETTPLTALKTLDRYTNGNGRGIDFRI